MCIYIYIYIYIYYLKLKYKIQFFGIIINVFQVYDDFFPRITYIRGVFNNFPDFFVLAFKIVVD